ADWHAHPDVWVLIAILAGGYWLLARRVGPRVVATGTSPVTRAQVVCFGLGVAAIWVASDWPVHDLAEGYLYSAHMVQHLMVTLVAALLLVAGTPAWLARRLLSAPGLLATVRTLSRPVPALLQANLVLVLSHWPVVVNATVRNHPLHFVAHAVLLLSAVLMWMPVASPLPEVPRLKPPVQMLYLFLQTVVPTIPASFLTFGTSPLYRVYETFPRLWNTSVLSDQQIAGLIMKLGAGFYLWIVIAVIFFRWYAREQAEEEVLTWDDVERELHRLGRLGR
ncbi:MAG: cytochrome c oxidase assembly protein, partial [Acidimicrobiales bacterium]